MQQGGQQEAGEEGKDPGGFLWGVVFSGFGHAPGRSRACGTLSLPCRMPGLVAAGEV